MKGDLLDKSSNFNIMSFCKYLIENDAKYGQLKVNRPKKQGLASAKAALEDFVNATDDYDDDTDIEPTIDINGLAEAVSAIRDMVSEAGLDAEVDLDDLDLEDDEDEEIAPNGEEEEDYIENGVDLHTIVPHNSEAEQFSEIETDDSTELEESFTGWDDLF